MDLSPLCHKIAYEPHTEDEGQGIGAFHPTPITRGYTACGVNDTPNPGRYVASLEVVPPSSKTSNCGTYRLKCEGGISITFD